VDDLALDIGGLRGAGDVGSLHVCAWPASPRRIRRASRSQNCLASNGRSPSSTRASSSRRCATSSLSSQLPVAQAGDRKDDVVTRIDLEDRLCSGLEASRARRAASPAGDPALPRRRRGTRRCRSTGLMGAPPTPRHRAPL
jgi:hypothetical protein